MATVKKCDISGSLVDVHAYKIAVVRLSDTPAGEETKMMDEEFDMCQKSLERLEKFITRGTTPPTRKDRDNE